MKTSELTGPALDWAVAKCEGLILEDITEHDRLLLNIGVVGNFGIDIPVHWFPKSDRSPYRPSTRWAQGGPLIEREGITVTNTTWMGAGGAYAWSGYLPISEDKECEDRGPTPLIAAMRCYVASKLGDEVEIPEALL